MNSHVYIPAFPMGERNSNHKKLSSISRDTKYYGKITRVKVNHTGGGEGGRRLQSRVVRVSLMEKVVFEILRS